MDSEANLKKVSEALTQFNEEELSLEESVKIYRVGFESIEKAKLGLEKVKLEVEKTDE